MKDQHGGDIWSVAKRAGLSPAEIIDFSASINPLGLSAAALRAIDGGKGLFSAYPEPQAAGLTAELARYHKISALNILPANGSNEIIYLIAQCFRPKKALIVEPAFGEYRRALEGTGCVVDGFMLEPSDDFRFNAKKFRKKVTEGGYDICLVTNPTSHAGGLIARSSVLEVMEGCRGRGTLLVIDEAFCDFTEGGSVKAEAAVAEGVIVLRSMTKFFAMAGLRLGYAIASGNIIERLASLRPTWSVNLPAALAAVASLTDTSYVEATRAWFKTERPYMEALLRDTCGVRVFPGEANFFLCSLDVTSTGVEELGRLLMSRGVLIRDMREVRGLGSGYFRVALKSREDNELLASLLRELAGRVPVRSSVV